MMCFGKGLSVLICVFFLFLAGLVLMLARHHRPGPNIISTKEESLFALLKSIASPAMIESGHTAVFWLIGWILCLSVFFPAIVTALVRFAPADADTAVFAVGGVACILGGIGVFLLMAVSQMSFGFGGSSSSERPTIVFVLVPAFEIACGLWSLLCAIVGSLATFTRHLLGA
jgi:hypothetical protein